MTFLVLGYRKEVRGRWVHFLAYEIYYKWKYPMHFWIDGPTAYAWIIQKDHTHTYTQTHPHTQYVGLRSWIQLTREYFIPWFLVKVTK